MKNFSTTVWDETSGVIDYILNHPFIKELATGCLDPKIFKYYIEQDSYYLEEFSRCLLMTASKCEQTHMKYFLSFAEEALISELESVHSFFTSAVGYKNSNEISPANLFYTSYLKSICAMETVSICIAALLPCFWIYREVGRSIADGSVSPNPYDSWINTYASADFSKSVDQAIQIFDDCAALENHNNRNKMKTAFLRSSILELKFWDDAYNARKFGVILW